MIDKEQLVKQAFTERSDETIYNLFEHMYGQEVFIEMSNDNKEQVPILETNTGLRVIIFYTQKNNTNLSGNYAGTLWQDGLKFVASVDECEGVVLQSNSNSWAAIKKEDVEKFLQIYESSTPLSTLTAPIDHPKNNLSRQIRWQLSQNL